MGSPEEAALALAMQTPGAPMAWALLAGSRDTLLPGGTVGGASRPRRTGGSEGLL